MPQNMTYILFNQIHFLSKNIYLETHALLKIDKTILHMNQAIKAFTIYFRDNANMQT